MLPPSKAADIWTPVSAAAVDTWDLIWRRRPSMVCAAPRACALLHGTGAEGSQPRARARHCNPKSSIPGRKVQERCLARCEQVCVTWGHAWNKTSCRGQPVAGDDCPRRGGVQRRSTTTANTCTHFPPPLQRKISSALIKLEEMSALRRCPPALLSVHLAVACRPAREARQLRHVLLPPARLRRGARRLGGAAAAPLHCAGPAPR